MSLDNAKNFAKVVVSTGYDSAATSIVLNSGNGALLPAAPFNAVWWNSTDFADPSDDPNVEIVRVTNIATDTLTVTRAQEGTTAKNHNTGGKTYRMIAGVTSKTINSDLPHPLADHFADAGNTGTSETDLYIDTVAGATLSTNGHKLHANFSGSFAASPTATRQLRVYFAGTLIFDSGALSTTSAGAWQIEIMIIRESSSVVRCIVWAEYTGPATPAAATYTRITGLTLTSSQTLRLTGQAAGTGASSGDINATIGHLELLPAA